MATNAMLLSSGYHRKKHQKSLEKKELNNFFRGSFEKKYCNYLFPDSARSKNLVLLKLSSIVVHIGNTGSCFVVLNFGFFRKTLYLSTVF